MKRLFELISKTFNSFQSNGVIHTVKKVFDFAYKGLFRTSTKDILSMESPQERFEKIYSANFWMDKESRSGAGSTIENTKILREKLPSVFTKYKIEKILDAPCGDFNWMPLLLDKCSMINSYVGGDIVRSLIKQNSEKHSTSKISFTHLDITTDPLPQADLMIVRDCLFHLSYEDIFKFLKNFCCSEIKYLLTTNNIVDEDYKNTDIASGDSRLISLSKSPFFLPSEPLERILDYVSPRTPKEMCLFSREQIVEALK